MAEKATIKSTFQVRNINTPQPLEIQTQTPANEFDALKELQTDDIPAIPGAPIGPIANEQSFFNKTTPAPTLNLNDAPLTDETFNDDLNLDASTFNENSSNDVIGVVGAGELDLSASDFESSADKFVTTTPLSPIEKAVTLPIMGLVAANSVATSALDTIASSLLPDSILEPGDLLNAISPSGTLERDFFEQNKFAVQFTGDLALGMVGGAVAVNVAKNVGLKLFTTLQEIKGGDLLSKLIFVAPAARKADIGRKLIISNRLSASAGNIGASLTTNARAAKIATQYRALAITDAAKQAVQFELGMFASTNSSDITYPSSLDTATLWGLSLGGVVLPAGISAIVARATILRSQRAAAGIANMKLDPANIGKNAKAGNDVGLSVQADATSVAAIREVLDDPSSFIIDSANATEKMDNLKTVLLAEQKSLKDNLIKIVGQDLDELKLNVGTNASENEMLVQQAMQALAADPTSLSGVKSLVPTRLAETVRVKIDDGIVNLDKQIANLEKKLRQDPGADTFEVGAKIDELANKKNILSQLQINVLSAAGEVTALAALGKNVLFGDDASGVVFSERKSSLLGNRKIVTFPEKNRGGMAVSISIDEQLNFTGPRLKELSPRGASILYAHMKKFAEKYKPKNLGLIVLNEKSSFLKFRLAEEILAINPGAAVDIRLTGDLGTFKSLEEGLQFGRIQKQYEEYVGLLDDASKMRGKTVADRSAAGLTEQMIAFRVDLPGGRISTNLQGASGRQPLFGEGQSSLEQFFLSLAIQGAETIPAIFKQGGLDSIKAFMQGRGKQLGSNLAGFKSFIRDVENIDMPMSGSSLANSDKPTFASIGDNIVKGMATREHVIEQVAIREASTQKALVESANPFIAEMGAVVGRQDYNIARDLDMINAAARTGPSVFVSGRFSFRNSPTFQAINNINTRVQKFTANYIGDVFNREFEGVAGNLSYKTAISTVLSDKAALVEFGNFAAAHENAFFKGPKAILGPDDRWRYPLISEAENADQFASNQAKWRKLFDAEMPTDANLSYMREGQVSEVAMRGDAHNAITALTEITRDVGSIKAELQQITTGKVTPLRNLHLPPTNISGDELAFIVDPQGKVRHTINERTPSLLNKAISSDVVQNSLKDNQGFSLVRGADVERFTILSDDIFLGATDAGALAIPRQATGAISGTGLAKQGEATIQAMIGSIERQYNSASLRSLGLLFEKELNRVKVLDDAFQVRDTGIGFNRKFVDDTVFAAYRNQLLGSGTINTPGIVRDVNGVIETAYDKLFSEMRDRMGGRNFTDLLKKTTSLDKREAQSVIDTLGNYSPYSDTTKFIEEQLGQRIPQTLKKNNAQLSGVTTTLLLRFADMAQNTINILGTVVNTPAILNSLKRLPGESDLLYRERTAEFGPMLGTKEGEGFATLSPVTAMMNIVKFARSPEGRSFILEGRKLGYFQQQAAEVSLALNVSSNKPIPTLLSNGMKYATYLSDKSEEMSRMYAHLLGIQVGKAAGITNRSALHTLGNGVANAAIGDYRSVNRPGVFRGSATSAFGLFQTFAQQMAQRIFGYIENKSVKSLAIQNFMQGTVFGGKSLPGATQLNDLIIAASDQKESITTITDRITGDSLFTDLLLNGLFPSVPRLLGFNDAFAISGRGAADFRSFGGSNIAKGDLPQAAVIKQIAGGINAFVDQMREGGQFSLQQTAEIIATFSPNRFVARMGEVANGVALDKKSGVVTNDLRNATTVAAAMLSLRTQRVQDTIEARFNNNQLNSFDRDIKNRIVNSLSSVIRGGKLNTDAVMSAFSSYIVAGGQPANFGPFMNSILIRSVTPKSMLEIKKFLASKQFNQLSRLLNALQ